MRPVYRSVLLLAMLLGAAGAAAGRATAHEPDRLPAGFGWALSKTLAHLRDRAGRLVLVDRSFAFRSTEVAAKYGAWQEELRALGDEAHLYWRVWPAAIVLQPRFTNPQDDLNLELDELRAMTAALHRLVGPFAPYPLDGRYTRDQNAFYRSLTGRQLSQMRTEGGLSFRQLTADQQRHWLRVNNAQEYCDLEMMFGRAARIYGRWSQTGFKGVPIAEGGTALFFVFPDPAGAADAEGFSFYAPPPDGGVSRPGQIPPGETFDRNPRLDKTFRVPLSVSDGETTVGGLVAAIGKASGNTLRAPSYARDRSLLVFRSAGTTAEDMTLALADLYGWEAAFQGGKRWGLQRPRRAPAKDARDLHQKLRRVIPPAVHLIVKAESADQGLRRTRYARHYTSITKAIEAHRKSGARLPVTALDGPSQQLLANTILTKDLLDAFRRLVLEPEPRWRAVNPEEGRLTLEGEGDHPLLLFRVPRPDGKTDGWGWAVNTSSPGT